MDILVRRRLHHQTSVSTHANNLQASTSHIIQFYHFWRGNISFSPSSLFANREVSKRHSVLFHDSNHPTNFKHEKDYRYKGQLCTYYPIKARFCDVFGQGGFIEFGRRNFR
ncbi:hypothetical protein Pst134EB_016523 [Puccinia striiformis f. sp. tritici]|nr:hypothetical protein Pst134EB_016523 [Puccinia striiformis f. sp. tritici]